jgi:hypothetical protein
MRYIEIQEGVSLNTSQIESVKKLDTGGCEIYAHHRKYLSTYPYETIVAILKETEDREPFFSEFGNTMSKLDKVLNRAQHWAG